jgi:hypothetical protein
MELVENTRGPEDSGLQAHPLCFNNLRTVLAIVEVRRACGKLSINLVLEQWLPPRKWLQVAKWYFFLCPGTTCPRHLQVFPNDGTNPFHGQAGNFTPANVGNLSTSQFVAALAPGARVVKALNNIIVPNLEADPVLNGARRVAFISADDAGARSELKPY